MDHRSASVDAFRLLAACLVFFCHSIYTSQASLLTLLGLLGRWIIPFFFLVSGYYFQKSYTRQPRYAFSKIAKGLLAVTLFVNLFYLAFIGLVEGSLVTIANHFTLLVGTYFHLWFLTSMMLGYIVLWFLLTFGLERLMPNVAAVFLLLILSLAPYNTLFGLSPIAVVDTVFMHWFPDRQACPGHHRVNGCLVAADRCWYWYPDRGKPMACQSRQ